MNEETILAFIKKDESEAVEFKCAFELYNGNQLSI